MATEEVIVPRSSEEVLEAVSRFGLLRQGGTFIMAYEAADKEWNVFLTHGTHTYSGRDFVPAVAVEMCLRDAGL